MPNCNTTHPECAPRWHALAAFAALTVFLYLIPHTQSTAMRTHQAIVDALLAGNNWGRQALVGNLDFPVMPSLALLCSDIAATWLHLDGARLLCALSQACFFLYFIRAIATARNWSTAAFPLALALLLPFVRNSLMTLDPNWVAAVPAAAVFYHLLCWQKNDADLRDIILAGANCGLLALCGIGPAVIGAVTAVFIYISVRKSFAKTGRSIAGFRSLIWSTFAYCAALWLLWNWLVMDDMFFGLRDAWARADSVTPDASSAQFPFFKWQIILCLAMASPLCIMASKSDKGSIALSLLPQTILIPVAIIFSATLNLTLTGLAPLICVLIIAVCTLFILSKIPVKVSRTAALLAVICCTAIAFLPKSLPESGFNRYPTPPQADEITTFIDQFWPLSRTMLYGVRLPALFPDPAEKRFVARLDYQEQDLIEQANDEQLHILIPPPDGQFYPPKHSPLADIHANGKPWLILEKQWPGGWQLWRTVTPPTNESRLDFMR